MVVEHNRVRHGEVDARPTRTRAQKKESWRAWLVTTFLETIHLRTTLQRARRTVYAAE